MPKQTHLCSSGCVARGAYILHTILLMYSILAVISDYQWGTVYIAHDISYMYVKGTDVLIDYEESIYRKHGYNQFWHSF